MEDAKSAGSAVGEEPEPDSPPTYEQHLLGINECFVYKVPPLRTASGHRAEDWGLAAPLFTGCLRISQRDVKLSVRVYAYKDPTTLLATDSNLVLFGECPIEAAPQGDITAFVDAVIDSSRYYVLRIKDPLSARTTLLGVGFRDREVSFDFKNVLNEYVRFVDRQDAARRLTEARARGDFSADEIDLAGAGADDAPDDAEGADGPVRALRGLAIREGSKITIPLPGRGDGPTRRQKKLASFGSFGALAPPPPAGSTVYPTLTVDSAGFGSDNGPGSEGMVGVPSAASPQGQGGVFGFGAGVGAGAGEPAIRGGGAEEEEEWGSFDGFEAQP